ncbi:MAG: 30S ribosomal protein S8, partial [Bradymonadaceae bacterium]
MANVKDPIADFLTQIRNAQMADHAEVRIPGSKVKFQIAKLLEDQGYIEATEWLDEGPQGKIRVELRYDKDEEPIIRGMERVSKPSRRVYVGSNEIPKVLNGLGIAILSTSHGVVTDRQARRANVGGELMCKV